jgi:putative transposase
LADVLPRYVDDQRPAPEEEIAGSSLTLTFAELEVIPPGAGFVPDQVHVAVSIPPKVALADLVRRMKGASSHAVNAETRRIEQPSFAWQDGYGALSFGEKALPHVVAYIENQRAIQGNRRQWPSLERTSDPNEAP